jgi:hypothetical protein
MEREEEKEEAREKRRRSKTLARSLFLNTHWSLGCESLEGIV